MAYLLPAFKTVSVMFAVSAVITGGQALIDPIGFSSLFGLPLHAAMSKPPVSAVVDSDLVGSSQSIHCQQSEHDLAAAYISLMGVRQLGTGIIVLVFAYQGKWTEVGTILSIIGVLVAITDGVYLGRYNSRSAGQFHAIPGAMIAALAVVVVYSEGRH